MKSKAHIAAAAAVAAVPAVPADVGADVAEIMNKQQHCSSTNNKYINIK